MSVKQRDFVNEDFKPYRIPSSPPQTKIKINKDPIGSNSQPNLITIDQNNSTNLSETQSSKASTINDYPQNSTLSSTSTLVIPGQLNQSLKHSNQDHQSIQKNNLPDWYQIGWLNQIEKNHPHSKINQIENQKHWDLIENFIHQTYYGTWFHNAAIIFFAVIVTHYLTIFGIGWSGLILILSISTTYYKISIRRVQKNIKGDLSRELAKRRLFQDHESADWLNNFLHRFWLIYEPVLSATIVASVDQILVASTPSFLESIRMSTFTLGSKEPRIDFIRSHPDTEDDVVVMDWKFDFTPNDISDLTTKAALNKVNPKIVLTIKFGMGMIGAAKDIVVEDLMFCGTIRIRIKLMNNFPHLQLIDLSFLEKPEFDFVLKPIGFDLNMIPGLSSFIESQVHATLGPMMYDPNVFTLNLEQMLAGALVDSAIGVLQVTLVSAHGLKAVKIGGGTPDPYVTFSIGARTNLDRSKVKRATTNPRWSSVHFLLINSLNEILSLEILDYNEVRKDTSLGLANIDLISLVTEPEQESLMAPILHNGKPRGEVELSMTYHPCLVPKKLENGEEEPVPETTAGVVRLVFHQAKELDYKRSGTSPLSPYAKIYLNNHQIYKTPIIKRTNNPVYEVFTEALVSNKTTALVTVQMYDEKVGEDPLIGSVNTKLVDLLESTNGEQTLDWFSLSGAKSGKLRLTATWKGLMMAGAVNGARAYTPPIGVLKFWFDKAEDLKNVEALTGGKSDPYVRLMRSGIILARSQIHNNNLEPLFDEILYVPVHSVKDSIRVEVMDYQHLTKDRSLGIFELEANNLIKVTKVDELTSYHSTGKRHYSEYLKQEGKRTVVKGRIDFDVEFYPCLQMKFQPFDTCESDAEKLKTDNTSEIASTVEAVFEDNVSVLNPTESNDLVRPSDRSVLNSKPNDDYSESIVEQVEQLNGPSLTSKSDQSDRKLKDDASIIEQPLNRVNESSINLDNIKQSNTPKKRGPSSLTLTKEELMNHQSGVLVFNIMGGQIAKKNARLEFLFDDGYWPSYSTEPSKSTHAKWDETGECFIRELEWSRCVLKLNVAEKDTREEVYAEYTSGLKPFLDDCLEGPHEFVLEDLECGHRSTVSIQCRYIPIPITLEPRESINNMGILTVMLDHGKDLLAADRNGYSDPYAQFVLNGLKVFKSGIQKKTLNPKWMERFEVEVPSRVHAEFFVHVFDWDRVGASDKLGQAKIDLTSLEPLQQTTIVAKLSLGDKEHGQIQMRLTFRPNFISRSREATSTFTGGFGRVATGLSGTVLSTGAGVGIGAAKGVGTLGGGVLKGVGGVGKLGYSGIKRVTGGNKRESIIGEDLENVAMEEAPSALDSKMGTISTVGSQEPLASSPSKTTTKSITDFKLNIMIIGASELESSEMKTYVHVKRNEKPVYDTKTIRHTSSPEWNEAIVLDVNTGSETELSFVVYDKKKLGKDREIGMVKLNVWEVLKSEAGQRQAELNEPFIEGIGTLKIKLALTDFDSSGKSFKEVSPKRNVSGGSPLGLLSSLTGGSHHHLPLALPTSSPQKPISTIVQPQASFLDQDPNELAGGTINQKPNNRPGGGRFSFHRNR